MTLTIERSREVSGILLAQAGKDGAGRRLARAVPMAPRARPMAAKMPANLPTSKGVGGLAGSVPSPGSLVPAGASTARPGGGAADYAASMGDAWVWDMYRPARFVKSAKVLTFRDVSFEEIQHRELEIPDQP